MKKIYSILLLFAALFICTPIMAQSETSQQAVDKIRVVISDDAVMLNDEKVDFEAVPERFWQIMQQNPGVKYSITSASADEQTRARVQQLSKMVSEYISQKMLLGGGASTMGSFQIKEENSLQIDIEEAALKVRVGKSAERYALDISSMDSLEVLVREFILARECSGLKMEYGLPDGRNFEHQRNDAVVITFAKQKSAEVDKVAGLVGDAVANAYNARRSMLSQSLLGSPYYELDNATKSVFMAAVPKRTQSNVVQTKAVREVAPPKKGPDAKEVLKKCLIKADGTFAWEGKSYSIDEIVNVLGVDFDTSKLMLDAPLVKMLMEKAFGDKAPNLNHIDTASLLRVLGFSMPGLAGGFVNLVSHSVKVLKENPEFIDAYVPIEVRDVDLCLEDNAGVEVQQVAQARRLLVRFTVVGNQSCRSGQKKFNISLLELATACEMQAQHTAEYENEDLLIEVPFCYGSPINKGTFLVSISQGKRKLAVAEVEIMQ